MAHPRRQQKLHPCSALRDPLKGAMLVAWRSPFRGILGWQPVAPACTF
jgi:hypothetical protein